MTTETLITNDKHKSLNLGTLVIFAVLVLMGAVIAMALSRQNQTQPTSGPAPDFSFTTFDGDSYRLSDFRGKVVIINFWASWCTECGYEADDLQSVWEYYEPTGEVIFLGIAYADNGPRSLEYIERYGITYLNAPDLGTRISEDYRITGVPETFIVDQNGDVAHFIYGVTNRTQLTSIIENLLAKEAIQ